MAISKAVRILGKIKTQAGAGIPSLVPPVARKAASAEIVEVAARYDMFGNNLDVLPDALVTVLERATEAYSKGELEQAKDICKTGLKEHTYNRQLLMLLARIYFDEKNYLVADFFATYACRLETYNEHVLKAEIYYRLGNRAQAKPLLEEAIALSSESPEAIRLLAAIARDDEDYKTAKTLAAQCLKLDKKDYLAHHVLGSVAFKNEDYGSAIKSFKASLKYKPDYVPAMEGLAAVLIKQEEIDEARTVLGEAVKHNSIYAKQELAKLLFKEENYAEAKPLLQEIIKDRPGDEQMVTLLCELLQKEERPEEAKKVQEECNIKLFIVSKKIPFFVDEAFTRLYYKHHSRTMVNWDGLYSNYSAAKYIAQNNIPGDAVECGVLEGGSLSLIAESFKLFGVTDKKMYFYDTFEGMNEPTEKDVWVADTSVTAKDHYFEGMGKARYDVFLEGLKNVDYPQEKLIVVKGKVEETIPNTIPESISLLRLDTDWYESTMHELVHLYPRLVKGGILICDDYGSWKGAREAMDEYAKENKLNLYFHTNIIQGATIAVKY